MLDLNDGHVRDIGVRLSSTDDDDNHSDGSCRTGAASDEARSLATQPKTSGQRPESCDRKPASCPGHDVPPRSIATAIPIKTRNRTSVSCTSADGELQRGAPDSGDEENRSEPGRMLPLTTAKPVPDKLLLAGDAGVDWRGPRSERSYTSQCLASKGNAAACPTGGLRRRVSATAVSPPSSVPETVAAGSNGSTGLPTKSFVRAWIDAISSSITKAPPSISETFTTGGLEVGEEAHRQSGSFCGLARASAKLCRLSAPIAARFGMASIDEPLNGGAASPTPARPPGSTSAEPPPPPPSPARPSRTLRPVLHPQDTPSVVSKQGANIIGFSYASIPKPCAYIRFPLDRHSGWAPFIPCEIIVSRLLPEQVPSGGDASPMAEALLRSKCQHPASYIIQRMLVERVYPCRLGARLYWRHVIRALPVRAPCNSVEPLCSFEGATGHDATAKVQAGGVESVHQTRIPQKCSQQNSHQPTSPRAAACVGVEHYINPLLHEEVEWALDTYNAQSVLSSAAVVSACDAIRVCIIRPGDPYTPLGLLHRRSWACTTADVIREVYLRVRLSELPFDFRKFTSLWFQRVHPRVDIRGDHIVVVVDLRFDYVVATLPDPSWDCDWTRRLVQFAAMVPAALHFLRYHYKSLQIVFLPPRQFDVMMNGAEQRQRARGLGGGWFTLDTSAELALLPRALSGAFCAPRRMGDAPGLEQEEVLRRLFLSPNNNDDNLLSRGHFAQMSCSSVESEVLDDSSASAALPTKQSGGYSLHDEGDAGVDIERDPVQPTTSALKEQPSAPGDATTLHRRWDLFNTDYLLRLENRRRDYFDPTAVFQQRKSASSS